MAFYLVRAKPKKEKMKELEQKLKQRAFENLQPFGRSVSYGLRNTRMDKDGTAVWEEEDYCSPPLAEERAAVLDKYFDNIEVERVNLGEGWERIKELPRLFKELI